VGCNLISNSASNTDCISAKKTSKPLLVSIPASVLGFSMSGGLNAKEPCFEGSDLGDFDFEDFDFEDFDFEDFYLESFDLDDLVLAGSKQRI
jgi:hypothetical protein